LHAGRGRPTDAYAGFCGQLRLDWYFCQPADPQAKGAVERLQEYMESNFEPGRHFANHLDARLDKLHDALNHPQPRWGILMITSEEFR
jgi:IS30 family transposase